MNARNTILESLKAARGRREIAPPIPALTSADIFADLRKEDLLLQFKEKLENLKGQLIVASNKSQLIDDLVSALALPADATVLVQRTALLEDLVKLTPADLIPRIVFRDQFNGDMGDFSKCSVGITEFDFAIARTGSIALRTSTAGGRALSVLPPIHVAIGRISQLVPSIEDWLKQLNVDSGEIASNLGNPDPRNLEWSFATLISGPSRTADIEKILVFGAHGPKRLIVALLED